MICVPGHRKGSHEDCVMILKKKLSSSEGLELVDEITLENEHDSQQPR